MIVMRGWLDRNRYEATRFDCDQDGDVLVLTSLWSGSDFARRFDGYSIHHTTAKVRTFPSSQCAFAATWVRLSMKARREAIMRSVTIRLNAAEFSAAMTMIR